MRSGQNGHAEIFSDNIILYKKTSADTLQKHWFGWKSSKFLSQTIRVTVWLKFEKKIQVRPNFGIKICGATSNEFLNLCAVNKWCYATAVGVCGQSSDGISDVKLTFNGMPGTNTVYISQLKAQILQCSKFIYITHFWLVRVVRPKAFSS